MTRRAWSDVADDLATAVAQAERAARKHATLSGLHGDERENTELAIGKHLHDAYSAGEKALERVIELVDGELPPGRSFHRDLIQRATRPQDGVRGAIISEDTAAALLQLVAFRHVFRHVYGGFVYALAAPNVPIAAEALPRLREEVTRFAAGFGAEPAA